MVLDEPTAGVDIELRESLWAFMSRLNEAGHTIVLTTHYLEEAENLCRHVAFLKGGRLVAHSDTQTLLAGRRMEDTFKRILAESAVE
jgi:ABC-2 type transport system ATP-binding protein